MGRRRTNHSTLSESADLLDSTRSTLLEGNTVHLQHPKRKNISLPPECHLVDVGKIFFLVSLRECGHRGGLHQTNSSYGIFFVFQQQSFLIVPPHTFTDRCGDARPVSRLPFPFPSPYEGVGGEEGRRNEDSRIPLSLCCCCSPSSASMSSFRGKFSFCFVLNFNADLAVFNVLSCAC